MSFFGTYQMAHNLGQNGQKVQTLYPSHNIKGGKVAHLDSRVASSMTLAGMGVCCSILFNPRLRFRTKYMYIENCDPVAPPPLQIKGNWPVLVFAQLHLWFEGDGGLLFHFILSKIVGSKLTNYFISSQLPNMELMNTENSFHMIQQPILHLLDFNMSWNSLKQDQWWLSHEWDGGLQDQKNHQDAHGRININCPLARSKLDY